MEMIYAAAFEQLTLLPRGPTVHLQPAFSPAVHESPQAGCLRSRAPTLQMDLKLNFKFNTSAAAPGDFRLCGFRGDL